MLKRVAPIAYNFLALFIFITAGVHFILFFRTTLPANALNGSGETITRDLFINLILILIFGLQHSLMARLRWKKWWKDRLPLHLERSTYILVSSLTLLALIWLWRPVNSVVWNISNLPGILCIYLLLCVGTLTGAIGAYIANPFELTGTRQVFLYAKGIPYRPVDFKEVSVYRYIRHPIMLCTLIFLWAVPVMRTDTLFLSVCFTLYILIAIVFEERDMVRLFGNRYIDYQKKTAKLIPPVRRIIRRGK